jgi:hypothetical protein
MFYSMSVAFSSVWVVQRLDCPVGTFAGKYISRIHANRDIEDLLRMTDS